MRRLGGVLAVLMVSGLLAAGTPSAPAATAPLVDDPVRILLVGDSVTQGSAGDFTWRYRLWQHFAAQGTAVDFVGPRSDLFDNIADTFGSYAYADPAFDHDHAARWGQSFDVQDVRVGDLVQAYDPDLVVELLGVNDLTWGGASPETAAQRLHDFATEARDVSPSVGLVLVRVPQTWFAGVPEFNGLVEGVADDFDLPGAPATVASPDMGFEEGRHTWDPAHPNAAGEVLIAAAVADAAAAQGVGAPFARPLPDVPLGPRTAPHLTVTPGDGRAELSWTRPPGATDEYVWTRDRTLEEPWQRLPWPVPGAAWTSTGLQNGHRYEFRLQPAKGTAVAEADAMSNVVEVVPQPPAPPRVAQPTLTARSHAIAVAWPPAERATSYRVTWWPTGDLAGARHQSVTSTAAALTSLRAGRSYGVTVQARNGGGWGPTSLPARGTPLGPTPSAPTALTVQRASDHRLLARWHAGSHATRYLVQVRRGSATTWTSVGWTTRLRLTTPSLSRGRVYALRVRSWHQDIAGGRSRTVWTRVG
jgi:hypothetical protein